MKALTKARKGLEWLFSEDEADDSPGYDPVHLGAAVLITITAIGALYWLLWTLLVYEGGLFMKLWAAFVVVFTPKTAADVGFVGWPYELGAFEGWFGNLAALAVAATVARAIGRLYHKPLRQAQDRQWKSPRS